MTERWPVRAVLVGVGAWGRVLANAAAGSDKIYFVSCVGRNPDRLTAFSQATGVPGHTDFKSALADRNIDAVILAVPNELHFPFAELAARSGKHVYIEKPIANNLADGRKIVELERKFQVRVAVGHCARFLTGNRVIHQFAEAGTLGKITQIEANFSNSRALGLSPANWRWHSNRAPGGALSQIAIHQFDTLRFLGGDIASISATAARHSPVGAEVEDQWIITVTFADGKLGVVVSNWTSPGTHNVRVTGDKALMFYEIDETQWASAETLHHNATLYIQGRDQGSRARQHISVAQGNMYRDELELFASSIHGAACELSAENGYKALAAVHAALISAANHGRTVAIDEITSAQDLHVTSQP